MPATTLCLGAEFILFYEHRRALLSSISIIDHVYPPCRRL